MARWEQRQAKQANAPRKPKARPARLHQLRRSKTMRLAAVYGASR
jgi:hypothetical protein